MKNDLISMGEIIKYHRTRLNITQVQLADGICTVRYLSRLENGMNIPTLFIVDSFSSKLGVNLYRDYFMSLKHKDIYTHKKIVEINEYLSIDKIDKSRHIISECECLESFCDGEPFQILQYLKACYAFAVDCNPNVAIDEAKKGLLNCDKKSDYSNIEVNLLFTLANNYARVNDLESSQKYFTLLLNFFERFIHNDSFSIDFESESHFLINIMGRISYSYFLIFPDFSDSNKKYFESMVSFLINRSLSLNLPELLLCLYQICIFRGETTEASERYKQAELLMNVFYPDKNRKNPTAIKCGRVFIILN